MSPSPTTDLKAFVPARDLELSKAFYADLGFTVNWSNDEIRDPSGVLWHITDARKS